MFGKIKGLFEKNGSIDVDASGQPTSEDLKIATAVLMLEMAGRDNDYAQEEVRSIGTTLSQQFAKGNEDVILLLEKADMLRQETQKIDYFIDLINEHFNPLQKQTIMAMLWKIVIADGSVDIFEERFTNQIKFRLKLSDQEVDVAKQLARQGAV